MAAFYSLHLAFIARLILHRQYSYEKSYRKCSTLYNNNGVAEPIKITCSNHSDHGVVGIALPILDEDDLGISFK